LHVNPFKADEVSPLIARKSSQRRRASIGTSLHRTTQRSSECPTLPKTKRLGLLLPSSNSTQEPEFVHVLPPSVSLHTARLTLTSIDADSTERIVEELEAESRKLSHADVGVVLLAATAPTSRKGMGYDQELVRRIRAASDRPATTASTATLEAFAVLGIRRVLH
jgi:maleate isomerase